jgi:hypothetical protein
MSMSYVVRTGDTLTSIAKKFKLKSWQELYNFSENAAFRRKRPNPNLIFTGDQLFIPDGGPVPPIPLPPKPTPPPTPQLISRPASKDVILPIKQFKGEKGEDIAYWSNMARITTFPDTAVGPAKSTQVDERAGVSRIDRKFVSEDSMFNIIQSQRWEYRFTWKVGATTVQVFNSRQLEDMVSQQVAMEIVEHPGHHALRPRKKGTSGFP